MEEIKKPQKKREKRPKKISKTYLENAGLFYLERYATSADNFRKVMMRKIKRSCQYHNTEEAEFVTILDDIVSRYISAGLLNDQIFARGKVASLRRKGMGKRSIMAKLQEKGLSQADIAAALAEIDDENEAEDAELEAALIYVKRKKLGAYRTKEPEDIQKQLQKELASLARAGFSYDIAKRALNCTDIED